MIEDAIQMLDYANQYSYDVIFGSRFLNERYQSYVPQQRRFLLGLAKLFERMIYRIKLTDSHNGLRVLNRQKRVKN